MGAKVKTHKGAAKRFKRTATGKILRNSSGRRHLLEGKAPGRKRNLRGSRLVHKGDAERVERMLPNK